MTCRTHLIALCAAAIFVGGCTGFNPTRLSGLDSYNSNRTPNPSPTWGGDPYTFNGIGEATGGVKAKTTHRASTAGYDFRLAPKQQSDKWAKGDDQRPEFPEPKHHGESHDDEDHEDSHEDEAHDTDTHGEEAPHSESTDSGH